MKCIATSAVILVALSLTTAWADTGDGAFALIPDRIALNHAGARHGVLVESKDGKRWTGDWNAKTTFTSSNPAVASVDAHGMIQAVGNGNATVTATVNGDTVQADVTVQGADHPYVPSFRNDVQPLLFRMGCSTGACHGAAGQERV